MGAIMLRNTSLLLCPLLTLTTLSSYAETPISAKEANFKAALIYKMGNYLSWQTPKQRVNYCFIGEDSKVIAKVLQQRQSERSLPKAIDVTNYSEWQAQDIMSCDIVYAPDTDSLDNALLQSLPDHIFTISNNSRALEKGFIASIELYNKKPLLSISKNNLKNSSVSVNSRFLSYVDLR